jgi:hypothetical protein
MSLVRALTAVPVAFFVAAVAFACGGDDSANNTSSGGSHPSSCASPCTPGALCYQPDPSSLCNGDWYCWDDSKWYCAPPDSGGPGDATVMFDTGGGSPEAGDEQPVMMGDAEAGAD